MDNIEVGDQFKCGDNVFVLIKETYPECGDVETVEPLERKGIRITDFCYKGETQERICVLVKKGEENV